MNRKKFDNTLGQAIICAILFAVVVAGMTALPRGNLFWEVLNIGLFLLLALLNGVMIIGFTSFQNDSTRTFYAYVVPIYPLYLISLDLIKRWEWWSYIVMLVAYGVCFFILASCFTNRTFTRSTESIVIVLFIFSTPYLYSAIF